MVELLAMAVNLCYTDGMDELKDILAKNLRELRKAASLTQLELAEQLHYSDKSVSKWEHGDAVPDIEVLARIAAFYHVTVDYLITEHETVGIPEKTDDPRPQRGLRDNKLVITLLAVSAVWIIATIIYEMHLIWEENYWRVFVWAVPVSCVVFIVFNAIWGRRRFSPVFVSLFVWTLITALYLQSQQYGSLWTLYLVGVPLQISVILWSQLKKKR